MAVVSIDLGTATQTARLINGVCTAYGYTGDGTIASKIAFYKAQLIAFSMETTKAVDAQRDAEAARIAARAKVDAEVNTN